MSVSQHRLIILSGPSCVGKSPLCKALRRIYPEISRTMKPLVLYNSRAPRPGEIDGQDYHFRARGEIETLRDDRRYTVMDVRGDLQALDHEELSAALEKSDVFFEGNPLIVRDLIDSRLGDVEKRTVFMAPLSREEIEYLQRDEIQFPAPELLSDVMRRKLLRRTRKQKGELSLPDLENIEKRASRAWGELKLATIYDHVIVNHDGEDSDNWDAFYHPLGEARKALQTFVRILDGERPDEAAPWPEDLFKV